MSEIEDLGVSVEEYLDGLAAGIDILELKRLEASGIPTHLALELMAIMPKVVDGTATPSISGQGANDYDTIPQKTTRIVYFGLLSSMSAFS